LKVKQRVREKGKTPEVQNTSKQKDNNDEKPSTDNSNANDQGTTQIENSLRDQ